MKLKKLFFSVLSVGFLWLTSFSYGADSCRSTLTHTWEINIYWSNWYVNAFNYWNRGSWTFCFRLNPKSWSIQAQVKFGFANSRTATPTNLYTYYADQYWKFVCLYWNKPYFNISATTSCQSSSTCNFPFQWFAFELDNKDWTYDYYLSCVENALNNVDCSSDSNYLQCLEDKNVLIWQVSTLSGDLNTCNTSLSSCLNGVDVSYQACIENLSWCQSDLTNMTNYNDSLNSQLNECLAELPVPCEWTGCEETIVSDQRFSFFRENDWERFSLPVANNVFLPQGFRAYVDSWVVAIARLQDKPEISVDSETFWEVNTLFFTFFKSVIIILLFALFLRFIKTLIYPLFIPKNKE